MRYYKTKGTKILGVYSEPQVLGEGEKQFQFDNEIINYHFDANEDLIDDTTQADIDNVIENEARQQNIKIERSRVERGKSYAIELVALIRGLGLTDSQFSTAKALLKPVRNELIKGDWLDAQTLINAITRPSNEDFGLVYDEIKLTIDNYVSTNGNFKAVRISRVVKPSLFRRVVNSVKNFISRR